MVYILDNHLLALTFLVSLALQGALLAFAFACQSDKLTDLGGSLNFLLLALLTLCAGGTYSARHVVASVLVVVWAVRLGGFLFYRVLRTGKDGRFDDMRGKVASLGTFFLGQLLWAWLVSLPVTLLNSPASSDPRLGGGDVAFGTASDITGLVLFALGLLLEATADQQKFAFKLGPGRRAQGAINDGGVWGWSRHPNFAGEIVLWWGMYALCLAPATHHATFPAARHAQYASVLSPIFTTLLLMFASGLPLAEKPTAQRYFLLSHGPRPASGDKWAEYKAYLARTPILFPLPPVLYRPLPTFLKRTVFLDFGFYQFDERVDGPKAVESEAKRLQEEEGEDA